MWSRQLLLGLLTIFVASPAFASTVVVGTSDTRACYFATLNSSAPAQLQSGLDTCTRAISANADDAYLHAALLVNRSDIRLRMADYSGAVADADASIALQPDLAAAYVNRGAGLIGLRHYRDALPPLEKAIAINQGDKLQEAYFNRGLAREYLGDIQGAYRDYKNASELDPNFEPAKAQLTRFTVIRR
jgi:tetratricopeptide (TPR) repeat protein